MRTLLALPLLLAFATPAPAAEPKPGTLLATFREPTGYLRDVLAAYDIPPTSQTLVFSKTSLQKAKIGPSSPRAVYFNDDVYVGYVPDGDRLEVMATSPEGAKFFTVDQDPKRARVRRQSMLCTACHQTARTGGVPGFLTQSLAVDANGKKLPATDPHAFFTPQTDHATPLADRFGGWFVTGTHGDMTHRGNRFLTDRGLDSGHGGSSLNENSIVWWADPGDYAADSSDLVALLVFEHQVTGHNLMTRAGFATEAALRGDDPPAGKAARVDRAVRPLLEYLLFVGEAPLTAPVAGSSTFTADFAARGPFDAAGRTLRAFDLETRMFRHRLSYLIHSRGFRGLPPPTRASFGRQLAAVLNGSDAELGDHLAPDEAAAIGAIVRATEPDLLDASRWTIDFAAAGEETGSRRASRIGGMPPIPGFTGGFD